MGNKRKNYESSEGEMIENRDFFEKVKANYFIYNGRLNRKRFAIRTFNSALILALSLLAWTNLVALLGTFFTTNNATVYFGPVVFGVMWLAANVSLGVRRAHDLNRSTKWYLWLVAFIITVLMHVNAYTTITLIIDIVIALFFIYCYFFFKGTVGANEYGEDMVNEDKGEARK